MARGIGNLNVSVTANTSKAIKNLKDFRTEARQVGADAKKMARDFGGNSIADYAKKFPQAGRDAKQAAGDLNTFRSSVVDLSSDVGRYRNFNDEIRKTPGIIKGVNQAMTGLRAAGKAAAAATTFVSIFRETYQWGLQATKSVKDLKTSLVELFTGEDSRGDALKKKQAEWDKIQAAQQKNRDEQEQRQKQWREDRARTLGDANRGEAVAMLGEEEIRFQENQRKFGLDFAMKIRDTEARTKAIEDGKQRQKEEHDAKVKKAQDDREKKEREAAAKKKKEQENERRDTDAVAKIRQQVMDFGRTDIQKQRAELLRTIQDPRLRREGLASLNVLGDLERKKGKKDAIRDAIANPQSLAAVDASSAEGFKQRVRTLAQGEAGKQLKLLDLIVKAATQTEVNTRPKPGGVTLYPANVGRG